MNKIEIPLSKTKLLLAVGGSLLFIVACLYLLLIVADQQVRFSPLLIKGVGVLGILFFGATGITGIKKIFDNNMGLTIDDKGITDNSGGSSIGLIQWTDITSISTEQISSTKFLLIHIDNPDFYLEKAKGLKRKMMEANQRMYGTPLSISSNGLKCKFEELEKLLQENLKKYQTVL